MAKVILRQEAIDDLTDIWNYTLVEWSEYQADKYYAEIKDTCKSIGEKPEIGRNYSKINKSIFGIKSGKHIIFYHQSAENEIEIIRILHERMDLKRKLSF